MGASDIVILDYGSGNVRSVAHALTRLGANVELSADYERVINCDGLVVPGVGAFGAVMEQLQAVRGGEMIERRLAGGGAVLGICVGLQIMFTTGTEHGINTPGLGQWPGAVTQLQAPVLPHMGWSEVAPAPGSRLFAGLAGQRFYFVHSYGVSTDPAAQLAGSRLTPPLVSWAEHGQKFVAAVENGALSATQFHPEKSGEAGAKLLANWLQTLPPNR